MLDGHVELAKRLAANVEVGVAGLATTYGCLVEGRRLTSTVETVDLDDIDTGLQAADELVGVEIRVEVFSHLVHVATGTERVAQPSVELDAVEARILDHLGEILGIGRSGTAAEVSDDDFIDLSEGSLELCLGAAEVVIDSNGCREVECGMLGHGSL